VSGLKPSSNGDMLTMTLYVQTAMVNGKFSTPHLSLEYMERGLRTAIAISEPVEQPVVVTAATNEVYVISTHSTYLPQVHRYTGWPS